MRRIGKNIDYNEFCVSYHICFVLISKRCEIQIIKLQSQNNKKNWEFKITNFTITITIYV